MTFLLNSEQASVEQASIKQVSKCALSSGHQGTQGSDCGTYAAPEAEDCLMKWGAEPCVISQAWRHWTKK